MLWPVTSSARCWASRPRSAVSTPMKVEMPPMALGPHVQGGDDRSGGARVPRGVVAALRRAREQAQQVVEERELLADQDLVLLVDALDLAQQALQLGALLARRRGVLRRVQLQHVLDVDLVGAQADARAGVRQQRLPLALEALAVRELGLDVAEAREHALDVLAPDRLVLREERAQQALRRLDLRVEVGDEAHADSFCAIAS